MSCIAESFEQVSTEHCHWPSYAARYPDVNKAYGASPEKLKEHYTAPSAGGGANQGRNCQNELAFKHAPILVLHTNEKYYPYDVKEWYKNTVETKHPTKDAKARVLKPGLDAKTLAKKNNSVNVLYNISYYPSGNTKTISYYVFYAYNGSKRIAGSAPTGAHEADMEEIHIEFADSDDATIAFIGLSSHGDLHVYNAIEGAEKILKNHPKYPGAVVSKERNIRFDGTRPIIYSAINAHALYGDVGSYKRFGFFGNDVTNEGFRVSLVPEHVSLAPDVMASTGYIGKAGVGNYSDRLDSKGVPKLYSKTRPHFTKVSNSVTYLAYIGFFILPLLVYYFKRDVRWAAATFFAQFYFIKILLFTIGPSIGIARDEDTIWHWLFPFRFF